MSNKNYIVKFTDMASRSKFYERLKKDLGAARKKVNLGEVLPDLIVYDVSEREFQQLCDIAGNQARFIPDFQHDLFTVR